jgi:carboxylesterase type B
MWSPKRLLLSLFVATVAAQSNATTQVATVTVRDNAHNLSYVGTSFQGIEQFQGINYGQDTSGANRFKPPKAFTYPSGTTVQATAAGASCPQNTIQAFFGISLNDGAFNISEDCLNLQVVRPAGTKQNANLPVMVWIYGDGFEAGSYNFSVYNPMALVAGSAAKGTPVLFVAMNYRVNIFGFANSPALRTEGSLNAGLHDQRLALNWVQSNIAAFGGNPKNVTLFGESDGGTSGGYHLVSNGGNGKIEVEPMRTCE